MAAALIILQSQANNATQLQIGSPAPDFTTHNLAGDRVQLADLRGSPVIINFWATWCGPCAQEMPILQSLADRYADTGLRVLAVNTGESPAEIADWQQRLDLRYDLLLDRDQAIAALFRLRGQPSTYIVDAEGIISHIFYGPATETALINAVETDLRDRDR